MTRSDILIIGAGVIGLSIARELDRRGRRNISIIEKSVAGREASWAAAGILAPQAEADQADVFFELCSESNELYSDFARGLLEETGIDIELGISGTLYVALSDDDGADLEQRFRWQRTAGLKVERLSREETLELEPAISPEARSALLFPGEGQVENRKLIEALITYSKLKNISITESSEVTSILTRDGRVKGVETATGVHHSECVVIATGAWSSHITIGSGDSLPVKPIRGQLISYNTAPLSRHVIYSPRGYLVPRADGRLLTGATVEDAGFDQSVKARETDRLKKAAVEILPVLAGREPANAWAGLRPFAADGFPVIGEFSGVQGLFAATGHYRNGILLAPLTARLIADLVEGRPLGKYAAFGPDRFAK